jgi:hypothetical protein
MSARIAENRVEMEKIWLKQSSRGLTAKKLNLQGPNLKKSRAKT